MLCNAAGSSLMTCEASSIFNGIRIGLTNGSSMTDSSLIVIAALQPYTDTVDDCTQQVGAICNFKMTRTGATQGRMSEATGDAGWSGDNVRAIKVFGSTYDFMSANPNDAEIIQTLPVERNGTIKSTTINGLHPEFSYYFRVATVDPAGNISNFTSETNIQNLGLCTLPADPDAADSCRFRMTMANP
jgi:hypothetical protein